MDETDAVVEFWTRSRTKTEVFDITREHHVPSSPVRDLIEVVNDEHMHLRGMLEWVDHPRLGRVILPNSPMRFHGSDKPETVPSPELGFPNKEIYGVLLGLSSDETDQLRREGTI